MSTFLINIFIGINICIYIFSCISIYINGGIKNNIAYSVVTFLLFVYTFLTPFYYYSIDYVGIYGLDIRSYYGKGFLLFSLNIISFFIGYNIINKKKVSEKFVSNDKNSSKTEFRIIFYVFFFIVLMNLVLGGINLINVFLFFGGSDETSLFVIDEVLGYSNYLGNFSDSLIIMLPVLFYVGVKKKELLIYLIPSLILFILMGYRYRVILTFLGLGIITIIKSRKRIFKLNYLIGFFVFFYSLMFITQNRYSLSHNSLESVKPVEFNSIGEELAKQTRGGIVDITVLKNFEENGPPYDYGKTMFLSTLIRGLPSAMFPNKTKPEPFWYESMKDLWKGAKHTPFGEAVTGIGFNFVSFGYLGVSVFAFLFGIFLKVVEFKRNSNVGYLIFYLAVVFTSFQYISRGYFPQAVDHFMFFMMPLFLLLIINKVKSYKYAK